MDLRRLLIPGLACLALLGSACGAGPTPTRSGDAGPSGTVGPLGADQSLPADAITEQLAGPWRRSPIVLDERLVAIISDACAAAARAKLGETEANLPTAVVDARGEHLALAILADDLDAILCLARLDVTGTSAAVDAVDRLSMTAAAPVDGTDISVASVFQDHDPELRRTYAFGRIGPAAESAKVGFEDASVVLASDAEEWWAMWWLGHDRASSFSAVDTADLVVGSARAFDGEREARVGPGTWWLDPAAPRPTAASKRVRALIESPMCASGRSPEGRIEPPEFELSDAAVTISFEIRWPSGPKDCQGVPPFPITIDLPEPLGTRALFDGSETPPRDASKPPAG
ncbi:MAG: hypothetical protein H0U52_08565 [Chloroflexi bacterium]|nr:hypothetical protein [Chloroflexota bacterium]